MVRAGGKDQLRSTDAFAWSFAPDCRVVESIGRRLLNWVGISKLMLIPSWQVNIREEFLRVLKDSEMPPMAMSGHYM